jgi:hypothetical protein
MVLSFGGWLFWVAVGGFGNLLVSISVEMEYHEEGHGWVWYWYWYYLSKVGAKVAMAAKCRLGALSPMFKGF